MASAFRRVDAEMPRDADLIRDGGMMTKSIRATAALIFIPASLALAGCGGSEHQSSANGDVAPTTTTPAAAPAPAPEHHSKLAGAAVGAVVGHELGGHALAGAAAGAAIQHHRNKKAR